MFTLLLALAAPAPYSHEPAGVPDGWRIVGAPAPTARVELTFAVKQQNLGALHDELLAVSTPTSAKYGSRAPQEDPLVGARRRCPSLGLMLPIFKRLGPAGHDVGRLEEGLRCRLTVSAEEAIATGANYAMPEAATLVGGRYQQLSAFLADAKECELRLGGGTKGRMTIHHLIEETLGCPSPYVSHDSEGYGGERVIVVRKKGVRTPEELELRRRLRDLHVEALRNL